jgi:tetratricopeptide (TPR) repeat protein
MQNLVVTGKPKGEVVQTRNAFRPFLFLAAASAIFIFVPAPRAQDQGESSSKSADPTTQPDAPPAPSDPLKPTKKAPSKKNKDAPTTSAPDQPTWDPLRAEKDLEVGQYYLHKGDLDAAIDRFEDAAAAKPGLAIPYRYLGEAQEKKGQKRAAAKSYTRYLDLYPHAEDAAKIRKKIDKLWKEVSKKDKSTS